MYLFKQISNEISPILLHLLNRAFYERIFPDILKIAKLYLYIKCDRLKPENHRHISLLPQFSKFIEKFIKNRLLEFLNKINILSNYQYGFRKHTSVADALADVIESVSEHLEHLNKCAIL